MPDRVKVHLWLLTVTLNNSKDTSSMKKFPIEIGSLHNKDLEKISAQIFQKKSDNLQNVALGLASLISNVHHHLLL